MTESSGSGKLLDSDEAPASEAPALAGPPKLQPAAPGGSAPDTRKTLMEMLKRAGEADVASLARWLGISGVAVRHHLAAMERDGQVTQRSVRRPVGRPARFYRLTDAADQAFPQNSDRVALELLARMEKLMGPEVVEKLFEARFRDLEQQYRKGLRGARSWEEKLRILAEIRNAEGYLCNLEPAPASEARGGLRLVEHHCPVAAVARQHPQMCRYELELFARVLGEPEIVRREHILSGGHACAYEAPGESD